MHNVNECRLWCANDFKTEKVIVNRVCEHSKTRHKQWMADGGIERKTQAAKQQTKRQRVERNENENEKKKKNHREKR